MRKIYILLSFFTLCAWTATAQNLVLNVGSGTGGCGSGPIEIDVTADNFTDVASISFSVNWDASAVSFDTILNLNNRLSSAIFNTESSTTNGGALGFSWFSAGGATLPANDNVVFTVVFNPAGGTTTAVEITDNPTPVNYSDINGTNQPRPQINNGTITINNTASDSEDPILTACPADITVTAAVDATTATATWTAPTATDDCSTPVITSTHNSGADFPIGTTTVTYTATDAAGKTATCSFDVTVEENPNNGSGGNGGGATGDLRLTASSPTVACGTDPILVNISADNFENLNSVSFSVNWDESVLDFGQITNVNSTLSSNANFNTDPSATDNGAIGFIWSAPSDTDLQPGEVLFTIEFVPTNNGNSSAITFSSNPTAMSITRNADSGTAETSSDFFETPVDGLVTIDVTMDDENPVISSCPDDIAASTTVGNSTTTVDWIAPTANDNCSLVSFTSTHEPGDDFPVGMTTVTYTATDAAGNTATCDFVVTVAEEETGNLIFRASNEQQDCTGGEITVDITTENFTNITSFSFSVNWDANVLTFDRLINLNTTLSDDLQPSDFNTAANEVSNGRMGVSWSAFRNENLPDNSVLFSIVFTAATTGDANSDILFADGNPTSVGASADDGNRIIPSDEIMFANGGVSIRPTDTTPPTIMNCPNSATTFTDPNSCMTTFSWTPPTATDDCGSVTLTSTRMPGSPFLLGANVVTYTATDEAGNTAECSFTVTVNDVQPPTISCPAAVDTEVADGMTSVVVDNIAPSNISDNCSVDSVLYRMTGVTTMMGEDDASGNAFNVGTTNVTYIVIDGSGNRDSCTFDVVVMDNSVLEIECPADMSITLEDRACDTIVSGIGVNIISPSIENVESVTWILTGATEGSGTDDASGERFNIGTTRVEYTVTSNNNQTETCSFLVTVEDDMDPFFIENCPANQIVNNDIGSCGALVIFDLPEAEDNCFVTVTSSPRSGDFFQIGSTEVTVTATDGNGNTATCTFQVRVSDTEMPTITCPVDVTRTSDTPIAVDGIDPEFSDNCTGAVLNYSLSGATTGTGDGSASGETFNVGMTTVTYGVTDAAGNLEFCSFTVTVMEEETPIPAVQITCPNDTTVSNAPEMCSAAINNLAPTFNDSAMVAEVNYSLTGATTGNGMTDVSGTTFNLGATTVTYIAIDTEGRRDTCSFTVNVMDTEAPVYTCISDTTIVADDACMATFDWSDLVSVTDNCSADSLTTTTSHESGSAFPLGTTEVILTATDKAGNADTCRFNVIVIDTTAPTTTTCPPDITQSNEVGTCGAMVAWTVPTFTDNCTAAADLAITASHAPNTVFPVGTTTVLYTATDAAGNVNTCQFEVSVTDDEAPILTNCPRDTTIAAGANCEASYTWEAPTATDNCEIMSVQSTHEPGATFPRGTTEVIYSTSDASGNTMVCSFNVTVRDESAPVFACPAEVRVRVDGTIISDPDGIITDIESDECAAVMLNFNSPLIAEDECDGSIIIARTDNTGLNSGDTFTVGTTTLTFSATDFSNNTATCDLNIIVEGFAPLQIAVNNSTPCANEDVKFVAEDIAGGIYEWILPDETTVAGANLDLDAVQVAQSGTYTVRVTDANGCRYQGTFDLVVAPRPQLTISAGDMLCAQEMGTLEFMVTDASQSDTLSFVWTGPNDFSSTEQNPSIENATTANSGAYTVTATNRAGCFTSATIDITVADRPENVTLVSATQNEGACVGETIQLTGTNFNNDDVTYHWIGMGEGNGLVDVDSFMNTATPTAVGVFTYQYYVTVGSCVSDTASVMLVVQGQPEVALAVEGETTCLMGNSDITLQTTSTGEMVETWLWSGPNNYVSDEQSPVLSNVTAANSGMYVLTATTNNGCSVMDTVQVVISDQPAARQITATVEANCLGNSFELSVPPYAGDNVVYQWSADNGGGLPTDSDAPSITVTPTEVGNYNYILTVNVNGCVTEAAGINITTEDEPALDLSTIPTELACVDGTTSIVLTDSNNSGAIYQWTTPSGINLDGNNATINNVTAADQGIYTVTVITEAGCTATSSVNISITDAVATPQIVADIDLPCSGDNVQLSVANPVAGAMYEWTGPGNYKVNDTSPILNNLGDQFVGEYFVTITKDGCTSATSAAYSLQILDTPDLQDDAFEAIVETPVTVDVLANDLLIADAEISVGVISSTFNGKLENNQDGTFTYTPGQGTRGFDQFVYQICYTDCKDNCEIATASIETKFAADECVSFNIISPNGDGQNDEFVISCVDDNNFPNNSLVIVNQWGDEVFRAAPYQNDWRGTHEGSSLPDGTYYYIFIPETGRDAQTGFITIQR